MVVSFGWQRSVQTVTRPDLPDRKLVMAKKNGSQKPNLASVTADPQAVNLRVTSVALTVDPPMAAPLIWFIDISSLITPLALHVEPWRLKRGPHLRRPRRKERWTSSTNWKNTSARPKRLLARALLVAWSSSLPGALRPPSRGLPWDSGWSPLYALEKLVRACASSPKNSLGGHGILPTFSIKH